MMARFARLATCTPAPPAAASLRLAQCGQSSSEAESAALQPQSRFERSASMSSSSSESHRFARWARDFLCGRMPCMRSANSAWKTRYSRRRQSSNRSSRALPPDVWSRSPTSRVLAGKPAHRAFAFTVLHCNRSCCRHCRPGLCEPAHAALVSSSRPRFWKTANASKPMFWLERMALHRRFARPFTEKRRRSTQATPAGGESAAMMDLCRMGPQFWRWATACNVASGTAAKDRSTGS